MSGLPLKGALASREVLQEHNLATTVESPVHHVCQSNLDLYFEIFKKHILKFHKKSENILDIENDAFYECAKSQFKIKGSLEFGEKTREKILHVDNALFHQHIKYQLEIFYIYAA